LFFDLFIFYLLGVNTDTGRLAAAAGANVLIAGSAIFGKNRRRRIKPVFVSKKKTRQRDISDDIGSGSGNNDDSGTDIDSARVEQFIEGENERKSDEELIHFIENGINELRVILKNYGR
jgi:hypothetical protein